MINRRLIAAVPESRRYIVGNVAFQWLGMVSGAAMVFSFSIALQHLSVGAIQVPSVIAAAAIGLLSVLARRLCAVKAGRMSFRAARSVKQVLRRQLLEKLLRLGPSYAERVSTSEVVQVASEGVEQLETYFGAYLPQFFYSMLAPVTLFLLLSPISLKAALALLLCVPLIPAAIAAVQTFAKRLLSRYWGAYTKLGDTFLENLQGLTTLKIYQADGRKHEEMNQASEHFRKITMKVLTMQLNSITIMDLVAFGGTALGLILAVLEFRSGQIPFWGCFAILLLSADFFLPMRQLGSLFHISMNGMAASDKIFALLDLPVEKVRTESAPTDHTFRCQDLSFSYEASREVLHGLALSFPQGKFTAVVGESGCGKSTLAAVLTGRRRGYAGSVTLGGVELNAISPESLMETITYVGFRSYLFQGTVAENLRMAKPDANDDVLWSVLERARLAEFLRSGQGLDTKLEAYGTNFSGGQRQRLALARALLYDTPVYLFDEATSNIDVESENDIMSEIHALAREKTVILISHRLAAVSEADRIYVLDHGQLAEAGTHPALLAAGGLYRSLWDSQRALAGITEEATISA